VFPDFGTVTRGVRLEKCLSLGTCFHFYFFPVRGPVCTTSGLRRLSRGRLASGSKGSASAAGIWPLWPHALHLCFLAATVLAVAHVQVETVVKSRGALHWAQTTPDTNITKLPAVPCVAPPQQIATRLFSAASPLFHWCIGDALLALARPLPALSQCAPARSSREVLSEEAPGGIDPDSKFGQIAAAWVVAFNVAGPLLHANALPWT